MAGIILLRYYIKDITYAIYNIDVQIIINIHENGLTIK